LDWWLGHFNGSVKGIGMGLFAMTVLQVFWHEKQSNTLLIIQAPAWRNIKPTLQLAGNAAIVWG
jgi:hypothetical protein